MGAAFSVKMVPDSNSIFSPGEKSVVSDLIGPDIIDDMQEFWLEFLEVVKDPVNYEIQNEQYFVKEMDIKAPDEDHYSARIMLDGKKIQRLMSIHNGEDICKTCFDLAIDRPKRHTTYTEYEPTTGTVKHRFHFVFHDEGNAGFRVEVWVIGKDGVRHTNEWVARIVQELWVRPLLAITTKQKVKVKSNVDSLETGGKSVLTDPLDAYFTADQAFEAVIRGKKDFILNALKGEINYTADADFVGEATLSLPVPGQPEPFPLPYQCAVTVDPKALTICYTERFGDELVMTSFYRIRKDPVQIEFWQMIPCGLRRGGGKQALRIRLELKFMLSEADLKEQLDGLDSGDNFML